MKRAVVVGKRTGLGLRPRRPCLRKAGRWWGSRSASSLSHARYTHFIRDVASDGYRQLLREQSAEPLQAVIYAAGIGEPLSLDDLARELRVFEVNLMADVSTAAIVLPAMLAARHGSLFVISSLADGLVSSKNPSYDASKAALSSYFEGLGNAFAN